MREMGANPGRAGHRMALAAGRVICDAREKIASLFGIGDPTRVIFTLNATEAINLALRGFLKAGDHAITTSMEHNSVTRPMRWLESKGVDLSVVPCCQDGSLDLETLERHIRPDTRLICVTHASNVTGTIMPVEKVGEITRKRGIAFLVDAAQSAGAVPIDVEVMKIDLLAFPGHKGLFGPQGTGGLYLREGIDLEPLKTGGSGSQSESDYQPEFTPDRYESGTPNTVGIAGLAAGVEFILETGVEIIRAHEQNLMRRLLDGLGMIPNVRLYGPKEPEARVGVIPFNIGDIGSSEVSFILDKGFDIATRSGLHCAPWAHRTIGTLDQGVVRISLSYFNTEEEIDQTLNALEGVSAQIC